MRSKKILLILLSLILAALLAAGCTLSQNDGPSLDEPSPAVGETDAVPTSESVTDENGEASAEPTAEPDVTSNPDGEQTFSFADLADLEFWFGSGAGAWSTSLNINEDGTFAGEYLDSEAGSIGEDYPNGTKYVCSFTGKFSQPEKINGYTYSMKIEGLEPASEPDTEEIVDGIKYIYSEPYGLADAESILLYMPGAPVAELPQEYRQWVGYHTEESYESVLLPYYGLYNESTQSGFSSHDISDVTP